MSECIDIKLEQALKAQEGCSFDSCLTAATLSGLVCEPTIMAQFSIQVTVEAVSPDTVFTAQKKATICMDPTWAATPTIFYTYNVDSRLGFADRASARLRLALDMGQFGWPYRHAPYIFWISIKSERAQGSSIAIATVQRNQRSTCLQMPFPQTCAASAL